MNEILIDIYVHFIQEEFMMVTEANQMHTTIDPFPNVAGVTLKLRCGSITATVKFPPLQVIRIWGTCINHPESSYVTLKLFHSTFE